MKIMRQSIRLGRRDQQFPIVLLSIYFFFYIFLPPITGLNMRLLFTACNIIFVFAVTLFRRKIVIAGKAAKGIYGFMIFYVLFLIIQLLHYITDSSNRNEVAAATLSNTLLILHAVAICLFLSVLCKFYGLTFRRFLGAITGAGIIELILVMLALLVPSIKSQFIQLIVKNSKSEEVIIGIQRYAYERSFGFADNLFDTFGYISALIIGLTFLTGISEKNKKITVLSLVMLIMPLLNSRSGLMLSIIGILVVCFRYFKPQNVIKYIIAGVAVVVLAFFAWKRIPENTVKWITTGITQTWILLTGGGATGVYNELFHVDMQFPPDFLLGAGYAPQAIGIVGIDSGYVQCIWRYGLFGTIVLFLAIIHYFSFFGRTIGEKRERVAFTLILVIMFIYLIKLLGLVSTGANLILFGTPIVAFYSSSNPEISFQKGKMNGI